MAKFAVITPYFSETREQLMRCHQSIAEQTIAGEAQIEHFMVCDAAPQDNGAGIAGVRRMVLPCNSGDAGATPRGLGMALAWTNGDFDGVLFLDADNTFEPDHIERMWFEQRRTGADIVTCPRRLISHDGGLLGICTESDGDRFNDTNCYLIMRPAWPIVCHAWLCQSRSQGLISDRVVWDAVKAAGLRFARSPQATVNYVTLWAAHYTEHGAQPPENARMLILVDDTPVHMTQAQLQAYLAQQRAEPIG